jgi:hypothetical protein
MFRCLGSGLSVLCQLCRNVLCRRDSTYEYWKNSSSIRPSRTCVAVAQFECILSLEFFTAGLLLSSIHFFRWSGTMNIHSRNSVSPIQATFPRSYRRTNSPVQHTAALQGSLCISPWDCTILICDSTLQRQKGELASFHAAMVFLGDTHIIKPMFWRSIGLPRSVFKAQLWAWTGQRLIGYTIRLAIQAYSHRSFIRADDRHSL